MPMLKIKEGDCVDQIAEKYGFLPETVWDHPKNSSLKKLREDRNILLCGDKLFVPEIETKQIPAATGAKHKFIHMAVLAKFKLQLKKNGQPRAGLAYTLEIDNTTFSGKTDGDGWIEHVIAPSAAKGKVTLTDNDETYELKIGHLDPLDSIEGVQQRLQNLGFYGGKIDG
ncbi:MAG: hypothetical protein JKY14_06875, partial [Paraglaciecola sp.]|nr:hypothetical protein [Paraglaciecola sp.]